MSRTYPKFDGIARTITVPANSESRFAKWTLKGEDLFITDLEFTGTVTGLKISLYIEGVQRYIKNMEMGALINTNYRIPACIFVKRNNTVEIKIENTTGGGVSAELKIFAWRVDREPLIVSLQRSVVALLKPPGPGNASVIFAEHEIKRLSVPAAVATIAGVQVFYSRELSHDEHLYIIALNFEETTGIQLFVKIQGDSQIKGITNFWNTDNNVPDAFDGYYPTFYHAKPGETIEVECHNTTGAPVNQGVLVLAWRMRHEISPDYINGYVRLKMPGNPLMNLATCPKRNKN